MLENGLIIFFPVEQWLHGFNNLLVQRNVVSHSDLVLVRFNAEHWFWSLQSLTQLTNCELQRRCLAPLAGIRAKNIHQEETAQQVANQEKNWEPKQKAADLKQVGDA
ncbi:MAG: hypothetical protein WCB79_10600 [Halobacteriota archaeon]